MALIMSLSLIWQICEMNLMGKSELEYYHAELNVFLRRIDPKEHLENYLTCGCMNLIFDQNLILDGLFLLQIVSLTMIQILCLEPTLFCSLLSQFMQTMKPNVLLTTQKYRIYSR